MRMLSILSMILMAVTHNSFAQSSEDAESNMSSQPLVCKLSEPELRKRKATLQKEVFSRIHKVEELETGYRLYFPDDQEFVLKLMDFILAERTCCPFFQFELGLGTYNSGIWLGITGTGEVKEMLLGLIEEWKEAQEP
ncbi:MAG: hypothetical protein AAGA10_19265 [Bacteroidota bacterium]